MHQLADLQKLNGERTVYGYSVTNPFYITLLQNLMLKTNLRLPMLLSIFILISMYLEDVKNLLQVLKKIHKIHSIEY